MPVKMPQMSAQHGHGCRNKAPKYICTVIFKKEVEFEAYHHGIETECESVEAKEALNSCLGRVCSLLTHTGKRLIKTRCYTDAMKQYS